MQIAALLRCVVDGKDLTKSQAQWLMGKILTGKLSEPVLAGFLVALRMKGEVVAEITGFVRQMRSHAVRIRSHHRVLLDTCGTGGDGLNTFNISTLAALVIAACGVAVAKHGNRSVSSRCGSADLLERLGVRIDLTPLEVKRCLEHVGFAFLFAPSFHPAMRHAGPVRRALGLRTVFNLLGPLSNPAEANCQLLGVSQKGIAEKMIRVLQSLGCKHAIVVRGKDGMDEVSLAADTVVYQLEGRKAKRYRFRPEDAGLKRVNLGALKGGNPKQNARIARGILEGRRGPKRDAVVLNAAFGLLAAGRVKKISDGIVLAGQSLESGRARRKLDELIRFTQKQ